MSRFRFGDRPDGSAGTWKTTRADDNRGRVLKSVPEKICPGHAQRNTTTKAAITRVVTPADTV